MPVISLALSGDLNLPRRDLVFKPLPAGVQHDCESEEDDNRLEHLTGIEMVGARRMMAARPDRAVKNSATIIDARHPRLRFFRRPQKRIPLAQVSTPGGKVSYGGAAAIDACRAIIPLSPSSFRTPSDQGAAPCRRPATRATWWRASTER